MKFRWHNTLEMPSVVGHALGSLQELLAHPPHLSPGCTQQCHWALGERGMAQRWSHPTRTALASQQSLRTKLEKTIKKLRSIPLSWVDKERIMKEGVKRGPEDAEGHFRSSGMVKVPRKVGEGIFSRCYRAWKVAWRHREGWMVTAVGGCGFNGWRCCW